MADIMCEMSYRGGFVAVVETVQMVGIITSVRSSRKSYY